MKTLTLNNETTFNFTDESTILSLVTVLDTFAEVDEMREALTEENLAGATFDGETVENIVPVVCYGRAEVDGKVVVTFSNRVKTEVEIMSEQITELQEAMAEIAGEE